MVAAAHEEQAGTGSIDFSQLAMFNNDDERGEVSTSAAPWVSHFGLNRTPFGKRHRGQGPLQSATPTPRPWPASASAWWSPPWA